MTDSDADYASDVLRLSDAAGGCTDCPRCGVDDPKVAPIEDDDGAVHYLRCDDCGQEIPLGVHPEAA